MLGLHHNQDAVPTMSSLALLILFITIAVFSLAVVSYINEREKRQKILRKKLNHIKRKSTELEELVVELDQLVESRAIPRIINEDIIEMLAFAKESGDDATFLQASYQAAIARHDVLSDETRDKIYDRLKESDKQIARAQKYLKEAGRIIRKQQSNGKISLEEMNAFIGELAWAHLTTEAVTFVGQGHKAINRNDVLSAHAFYRKAQHLLTNSGHANPLRHRMVKELSDIMAGRRKALSSDLMPESQYNPGDDGTTSFSIDDQLQDFEATESDDGDTDAEKQEAVAEEEKS